MEVVPADGQVYLDGRPIHLTHGKARLATPPLEPGWRYEYQVSVYWNDARRDWTVSFRPGETLHLVFRRDEAPPQESKAQAAEQESIQNYGIDVTKLNGSNERITLDGREITRVEAARMLQANGLTDDTGKLRLTIIGSDAERGRVLDDLKGPLADIARECLVQDYPPNHWAVAKAGFYTAGKPTIYIQAPDGQVLHRQDDYSDGAQGLRRAFEVLRKPSPDYRPDKDKDCRRPGGLLDWLGNLMFWPFRVLFSWLVAAMVIFIILAMVLKGWPIYLLGLLARWIPGPPQQSTEKHQSAKRISTARHRKK